MLPRVDERAVVALAVELDEMTAHLAKRLRADRRIVQVGARATVGELHAPQNQTALRLEVLRPDDGPGGVTGFEIERRRDLALLLAVAHDRTVAPAAERKRERVEQDRLAGAGLAGQHGQSGAELEVQPVDQDDVAYIKLGEHGRRPSQSPMDHSRLRAHRALRRHDEDRRPERSRAVSNRIESLREPIPMNPGRSFEPKRFCSRTTAP